jgi:hypothetical protein
MASNANANVECAEDEEGLTLFSGTFVLYQNTAEHKAPIESPTLLTKITASSASSSPYFVHKQQLRFGVVTVGTATTHVSKARQRAQTVSLIRMRTRGVFPLRKPRLQDRRIATRAQKTNTGWVECDSYVPKRRRGAYLMMVAAKG